MPIRVMTMLQRKRRDLEVCSPTRWITVGVTNATIDATPLPRLMAYHHRADEPSSSNRAAKGAVNRNATRICTPGNSTRSSCIKP